MLVNTGTEQSTAVSLLEEYHVATQGKPGVFVAAYLPKTHLDGV